MPAIQLRAIRPTQSRPCWVPSGRPLRLALTQYQQAPVQCLGIVTLPSVLRLRGLKCRCEGKRAPRFDDAS